MYRDPTINWPDEINNNAIQYSAVLSETYTNEGTEPVTLQEAKDYCAVDGTDHDTTLTWLIKAARHKIELRKGSIRPLVSKDCSVVVYPGTPLPFNPLASNLASITDEYGNAVTGLYKDIKGMGKLTVVYSVTAKTVPSDKEDILNEVAYLFDNKGTKK